MEDNRIQELLDKYLNGTATLSERQLLESHYNHLLSKDGGIVDRQMLEIATAKMQESIHERTGLENVNAPSHTLFPVWLKYAAIIILSLSVGISLYWYSSRDRAQPSIANYTENDVPPGGNRATLSFSDGKSITLNENKDGIIAGAQQYTYTDGETVSPTLKETEYATLTTPRGGQYQITLPDGTKVWLNAASSLRYPVVFNAGERKVELTGEGYFEVAHDEQHPFIVESKSQSVQVLGTSFNINAYADENVVTTTLVNGSVKLSHSRSSREQLLQPGEQAVLRGKTYQVQSVEAGDFTSWKNGLIVLNDADLSTIIRQIERWYDVEFIMPETTAAYKVFGELNRDVNLSQILNALQEYYGLNFKMEGRRIIVSN